jgi:hypothetical protein
MAEKCKARKRIRGAVAMLTPNRYAMRLYLKMLSMSMFSLGNGSMGLFKNNIYPEVDSLKKRSFSPSSTEVANGVHVTARYNESEEAKYFLNIYQKRFQESFSYAPIAGRSHSLVFTEE